VNVDMIVQNVSADETGLTDVTFTCPVAQRPAALEALGAAKELIGFSGLRSDEAIAKISLVGAGMRSNPGVSATLFKALADHGINISMITTSEIRISVVTDRQSAAEAVRAVHTAFGLDAEGEAVVYGGTGR
jgi:aspartate kinase